MVTTNSAAGYYLNEMLVNKFISLAERLAQKSDNTNPRTYLNAALKQEDTNRPGKPGILPKRSITKNGTSYKMKIKT